MSSRRVATARGVGLWRLQAGAIVLSAIAFLMPGGIVAQDRGVDAGRRGQDLARRVIRAQSPAGFRIRARVVIGIESENAPRPTVLQIRMAGRREPALTRLLVQVLWPTALKGHAVVIEHRTNASISGFMFDLPDSVTTLTPALLGSSFAGSGLTIEDLADDFWTWPGQQIITEHRDGAQACTILESRPSREASSAYGVVRSCVDEKTAAPDWVEKYGAGGALVKRLTFERRRAKHGGESIGLTMLVDSGPDVPPTRVEFLKSEWNVTVRAAEFSAEALKRMGDETPENPRQD
jgi:hypothetical protein